MQRCGVAFLLVLLAACTEPPERPPNVLLIIADDLGWPYHGFLTSPHVLKTRDGPRPAHEIVETPNLDHLAAGGVTFTHGYNTSSTCAQSLRTYLSAQGLHSVEWASRTTKIATIPAVKPVVPRTESRYLRTLPRELARRGYVSWEGGKMWEGTFEDAGFTRGMAKTVAPRGVGRVERLGRHGWDPETCGSTARDGARCEALAPLGAFLDEFPDQPWFVWFAPMIPHPPLDPPAEYLRRYRTDLGVGGAPYLANVRWFDEVVGELLEEIERRGMRDDTLVVYASDNGWGVGELFGLHRGKATPYALGNRTPIVFNWPGHLPSGEVYEDLVSTADIPATILDYAGVSPIPGSRGTSLRPLMEHRTGRPHEFLFTQAWGRSLVTDEWRYVRFREGRQELYRIATDPFEEQDVARDEPALRSRFARLARKHAAALRHDRDDVEMMGRLVDRPTGRPLAGIELQLRQESRGEAWRTVTDDGGWFRFAPVPPGEDYRLEPVDASIRPLRWATTGRPLDGERPIVARGVFHPLTISAPDGSETDEVTESSR